MKIKTIGIIGSRRRIRSQDFEKLRNQFVKLFNPEDKIVSGGCRKGGDFWAEVLAREFGATITIHHANWKLYHKAAGHIRNAKIANDADKLIALVADDRKGGTESTIKIFLFRFGLSVSDQCKNLFII